MATATAPFKSRDVISIQNFSKHDLLQVIEHAAQLKQKEPSNLLSGHVMGSCFFEPSTRTRFSFEGAMRRLGGEVMGFSDSKSISTEKGESLYDTMRCIGSYVDIVVIRHPLEGAAQLAAESTSVPVINAGDGANQHPTQTLLDLFTIQECQGRLEGLSIAMVGDLKYGRTIHSLAQALTHFDARLYFVSPEHFEMPEHVCDDLRRSGIKFSLHKNIEQIIAKVDVLYLTRLQVERFNTAPLSISMEACTLHPYLLEAVKPNFSVLHPLPRREELPKSIDSSPYAYYFQQAENGIYVREALLGLLLGKL